MEPSNQVMSFQIVIPAPSMLIRMEAFSEIKGRLDYPTCPSLPRIVLILKLKALHSGKPQCQADWAAWSPSG